MDKELRAYDNVHWYMNEVGSRVVSRSGRPTDRFHFGKFILQCLAEHPNFILQVDGANGKEENCASVLARSIRCAEQLRKLGLKTGDVMALLAPNHLDLCIPFYAALYLGIVIMAVDRTLKGKELQDTFNISHPKIIFCQNEKAAEIENALKAIGCGDSKIITFDGGEEFMSFSNFLSMQNDTNVVEHNDFQPNDFDTEKAISTIIATSGTTGLPKAASVTYKNMFLGLSYFLCYYRQFPKPIKSALLASPLQWYSALSHYFCAPILIYTRIQTSEELTRESFYKLINEYKPSYVFSSPNTFTLLSKEPECQLCDFTCFENIQLGGSAVSEELLSKLRELTPNANVNRIYGMSEISGLGFYPNPLQKDTCGTRVGYLQYRLRDPDTNEIVLEANRSGELQLKGPSVFVGYYNNETATKETFSEDGWLRTGDLFRRDENYNYYFVERIKLLLKYRNHQIAPVELENVIKTHPGVLDVAVTSVPDRECGDLPVACVVRQQGQKVTAQEIKDLIKDNLTDSKQLRGGVVFMEALPLTSSMKIHRKKLTQLVLSSIRE